MNPAAPRGFTLIEMMIVFTIIATLAAIALPQYDGYIKRSRILDAVTKLADARAQMEQYFLDQRSYVDATGNCGVPPPAPVGADAFAVRCEATSGAYTYTATGLAAKGMLSFAYAIDQSGARQTISLPPGWSRSSDCWTIRQDGLCI